MEVKRLGKYFIALLLLTLIIFNWNEVSWVFNYHVISGFFSDLFRQVEERVRIADYFDNSTDLQKYQYSEKEDSIEIPKIEVVAPLVFVDSLEITEIKKAWISA